MVTWVVCVMGSAFCTFALDELALQAGRISGEDDPGASHEELGALTAVSTLEADVAGMGRYVEERERLRDAVPFARD